MKQMIVRQINLPEFVRELGSEDPTVATAVLTRVREMLDLAIKDGGDWLIYSRRPPTEVPLGLSGAEIPPYVDGVADIVEFGIQKKSGADVAFVWARCRIGGEERLCGPIAVLDPADIALLRQKSGDHLWFRVQPSTVEGYHPRGHIIRRQAWPV